MRLEGVVRWFDAKRGIGFIDSGMLEYFVHYRSIDMIGYKTLLAGQRVSFLACQRERGGFAADVRVELPVNRL